MIRHKTLLIAWLLFLPVCLRAQDITNFTQFFINPYTFNASYAGIEGRSALFLAYRKQWATIDGGPTVSNLSYHTPLSGGLNFGMNISNDVRGILNTSGMSLTLGYTVRLDQHRFIRFGLSGGGAWNTVDLETIANLNDPALVNVLNNNASLTGNAGISLHLKSFHIGLAMPTIFSPSFVSDEAFTITEVKPFQSLLVNANYRIYFDGDRHIFEPYVIYRMSTGPRDGESLPAQLEVAGVLHLNHTFWLGASYKQDFGISGMVGIKNKFFLVGASYGIANTGVNELNSPSYEIQLSYLFGQKKKEKQVYSFVNSEKEKIKKPPVKTPAQLAAEKKKEEELAKQKAEQERLAQEEAMNARLEEERKAAEAAALAAAAEADRMARQQAEEAERLRQEQIRQQPVTPPVQQPVTPPVQQPVTQLVQQPVTQPVQQPVTQPVQQPVTQPVQPPAERAAEVPKPLVVPYIKSAYGVHDGGPRFLNRTLLPVMMDEREEQVKIQQVEQPITNPLAVHGSDPNLNANVARFETAKSGSHPQELPVGYFVINGVFSTPENANRFTSRLNNMGFVAKYGYQSTKRLWYVYVSLSEDINTIKLEVEKYRNYQMFKDAWILKVEN
jgi:type IX secretion system PorP/SprF family membrane protein